MLIGYNVQEVGKYFLCLSKTFVNQKVGDKPHKLSGKYRLSEASGDTVMKCMLRYPLQGGGQVAVPCITYF